MSLKILVILACVPLYVTNSFCDKIISAKSENAFNSIYNCFKFFLCSICVIPMFFLDTMLGFTWGSFVCGCACAVMYAVSKTVMLKGYEATSVAFMTLCHSSGMIVPCVLGHFLWAEKLTVLSVSGIIITIIAVLLLKDSKKRQTPFGKTGIFYGLIIFLTSAGVMITQKLMGIYFPKENTGLYNFYSFFVAALILCMFISPKQIRSSTKADKKSIGLCALCSAISLSVISFVMTNLASSVPSVILFPLFNGLGIIFVCIGSVFAFKEKLNAKKITGLILGILGLLLVNF